MVSQKSNTKPSIEDIVQSAFGCGLIKFVLLLTTITLVATFVELLVFIAIVYVLGAFGILIWFIVLLITLEVLSNIEFQL